MDTLKTTEKPLRGRSGARILTLPAVVSQISEHSDAWDVRTQRLREPSRPRSSWRPISRPTEDAALRVALFTADSSTESLRRDAGRAAAGGRVRG